jgi:5-methylcytosine-specific restriction endonuclease McrA
MIQSENNIQSNFPTWEMTKMVRFHLFDGMDRKLAYKKFRNSCGNFISKKVVRTYVLEKFNYKCFYCDSVNNLQVDHIVSVYRCFWNNNYDYCNTEINLQILCRSCNVRKDTKDNNIMFKNKNKYKKSINRYP